MPKAPPAHGQQPGFLTGLSLLLPMTLSTMAIILLMPVLPIIKQEFSDMPNYQYWVPMAMTVPALCVALISPVGGILGDSFGRRKLLLWALALYAVVGVIPAMVSDFTIIFLSRIGVGIAEAMIMVLSTTMIGDYFKGETRDKWLAAQTAVASLSALLFFPIGGFLGSISWHMPFWVYGSALLMLLLVLFNTWEPNADDTSAEEQVTINHWDWSGFPWRNLIPIFGITIFASIYFFTVQIQTSIGLSQLGQGDPAKIGLLTMAAGLGVPIGTFIFSRFSKVSPFKLMTVEFAAIAIGFTLMARAQDVSSFVIGCFIAQVGAGMILPTLLVWAMGFLSFAIRARGAGLWTSSFLIGQFLSSILVPAIAGQSGGKVAYAFGVMSYGAMAAVLVAGLFWIKPRKEAVVE